jgi:hypothetical protein
MLKTLVDQRATPAISRGTRCLLTDLFMACRGPDRGTRLAVRLGPTLLSRRRSENRPHRVKEANTAPQARFLAELPRHGAVGSYQAKEA